MGTPDVTDNDELVYTADEGVYLEKLSLKRAVLNRELIEWFNPMKKELKIILIIVPFLWVGLILNIKNILYGKKKC